ncbi:MAG: prepilin-type N-terminal cleavage/methylation domain-containing protein [Planctomycetota bacterium]|jgi:prepilin-type N-terminal cleavage/methylation domain-containing protein
MKAMKSTSGLTLLELMVATAILAIGLLAMITVIVNSMHLEHQAKELNTAKNAAELQLQQLRGMPYLNLLNYIDAPPAGITVVGTTAHGNFDVIGLRLAVNPATGVIDQDGMCGRFEVQKVGAVNDNLLNLNVFIEWRGQRGGNQTFQLSSMRSDRGTRWVAPGP